MDGRPVDREPQIVQWDPVSAEKGGYDRFMQKEIFEQPRAITDTIGTRVNEAELDVDLDGIEFDARSSTNAQGVTLVACGTSYYASLLGKYMIEQLAGHPLRGRSRQRVPIPQADRRRASDRDPRLAVGRDRGHPRGLR